MRASNFLFNRGYLKSGNKKGKKMQIRSEHQDENKRLSEQVAAAPAPLGWMLVIYVGDPAT
jgi:hypothetical protein